MDKQDESNNKHSTPKRIELPAGLRPRGHVDEVADLPPEERKPKLGIRRPVGMPGGISSGGNSLVDHVEARARAEVRAKRMRKLKAMVSNVFAIVLLAAIAFGGLKLYKMHKAGRLGWIDNGSSGSGRLSRGLSENEGAERQATEIAERAKEEAKKRESEQTGRNLSDYETAKTAFAGSRVSYWRKLPKDRRPGTVDGKFFLLVPARNGRHSYYDITSSTNGSVVVRKLTEGGIVEQVDQKTYIAMLTEYGGLLNKDKITYLITPSGKKHQYEAPKRNGDVFNPAEAVFGEAYAFASTLNVKDLRFEVFFALSEKSTPRSLSTVTFGETVPYRLFADVPGAIAMEERRRRLPSKWKSKVFKPTVVMYDGLVISKGGGRVKVPRRAPYARGREYDKWQNLRSEALRQENEALRVESENQRAKQEWQKKMNGPADESETRKVLYAGIVTVKSM